MNLNDRTGQVWKLIKAIALVVGPPRRTVSQNRAVQSDLLYHPCVLLTSSSPGIKELAEIVDNPWDKREQLRRIT